MPSRELSALSEPRGDEIIAAFERHGVRYAVVGGYAARLHGAERPTEDFDTVVARDRANLDRVAAALEDLHAYFRLDDFTVVQLKDLNGEMLESLEFSRWRTDAGALDLLPSIPAESEEVRADLEQLLVDAVQVEVGDYRVVVASIDDIIRSKEALRHRRSKDAQALPELRALRDRRATDLGPSEGSLDRETPQIKPARPAREPRRGPDRDGPNLSR